MIEINIDQAIAGVKAIVAEYGHDYVYTKRPFGHGASRCVYVYEGQPDCLVGKFLAAQGVSIEHLAEGDTARFGSAAENLLDYLAQDRILGTDTETVVFLANLQYEQDQGSEWGVALRRATEIVSQDD